MSFIYMAYTWYILGNTMYIHQTGYTWYILGLSWIYHVYPRSIYMVYPWIYVVYHLMYIHGIYVVYRGISMDIPSFLKPGFAAGPCCWSHSMRTRVWVIMSILFRAPPWQLRQWKRRPTKAQPGCRKPSPTVACGSGDGGGSGGAAGVFPLRNFARGLLVSWHRKEFTGYTRPHLFPRST